MRRVMTVVMRGTMARDGQRSRERVDGGGMHDGPRGMHRRDESGAGERRARSPREREGHDNATDGRPTGSVHSSGESAGVGSRNPAELAPSAKKNTHLPAALYIKEAQNRRGVA